MTNKELIEKLKQLPLNAEVWIAYDSDVRAPVDVAYLSKLGEVVLKDSKKTIFSDENKPLY